MGTRNLTCVVVDGEYKVAQYCQWDGYPSGEGLEVLGFFEKNKRMEMSYFKDKVRACGEITPEIHEQYLINCGAEPKAEFINMEVNKKYKELYPELHRDTGADILNIINENKDKEIKLKLNLEFAADSLFCEWAYVIDLDKNTLEVYKGFNESVLGDEERFKFLEEKSERGYHPIKLLKSYDLSNLPTSEKFLEELTEKHEDE